MGNEFDLLIGKDHVDDKIKEYLLARDFYESTMRPQFFGSSAYKKLTLDKPCLRRDVHDSHNNTLRIFINNVDIYYEIETSYGSLGISNYYEARMYQEVSQLSELFNMIAKRIGDL